MATQKPISTISYNTEAFIREKLDDWIKAHIIQAYQYICHIGEDGDKDHIHLRIEPNKKLDPMDLLEQLREYVPGEVKPLCCRPFRPSKEEDWFLYVVHDKKYLQIKYGGGDKGEKIPYQWQDIRASEFYDVETAFRRAQIAMKHTQGNIASRLQNGEKPLDLIQEGESVFTINALYNSLSMTDYKRAIAETAHLREELEKIMSAIEDYGLQLFETEDKEKYFLQ